MKKVKFFQLAAAVGALMTGVGVASTASAETAVSFNVGAATDYVFRGIDQTGPLTEGEVFAGVDASFASNLYAGAWVSNTGSDVARFAEYDLYGGWKPTLGPVALDLGFIYYGYTDSDVTGGDESELSTVEFKVAGSVPVGGVTLGGALYYTPNFSGDADGLDDNAGLYYEVNAAYTFSNSATLSGAIGAVDVDDYAVDGYTTYNVGVTYPITENVSIDARYIGTDDDAVYFAGNGDTAVGTIKVTF